MATNKALNFSAGHYLDQFEDNLNVEEVLNYQPWRRYFLDAVLRLCYWEAAILEGKPLKAKVPPIAQENLQKLKLVANTLKTTFNPSSKINRSTSYLINLNTFLYSELEDTAAPFFDENEVIRGLYEMLDADPKSLVAACALFDAHLHLNDNNLTSNTRLILNVFNVITKGLNIWSLRREWQRIYFDTNESEAIASFTKIFDKFSVLREETAQKLREDFYNHFDKEDFTIQYYQRYKSSLVRSSLPKEEIAKSVFLKVIAPDEDSCYLVDNWLEKRGEFQPRWSRRSIFHPEKNGAKRFQICVRIPDSNQLIVGRISTNQIDKDNEWGRLLDLVETGFTRTNLRPAQADSKRPRRVITVFSTYGEKHTLQHGSTLADYIINSNNLSLAKFVTSLKINTDVAKVTDTLNNGDVIQVVTDPYQKEVMPANEWGENHAYLSTKKVIDGFREGEIDEAEQRRIRVVLELQKSLSEMGVNLNEDDLPIILKLAGKKTTKSGQEKIFASAANNQSLLQTAVKYYLWGRIIHANGKPFEVSWSNLRFHLECKPSIQGDIVGNRVREYSYLSESRYGTGPDRFVIHSKNCDGGPSKRNSIELKWTTSTKRVLVPRAFRITLLTDDSRGKLGEVLERLYENTTLDIKYVHADAIHFGANTQITLVATGFTNEELHKAESELKKVGISLKINLLSERDARQISEGHEDCPYKLFPETEMYKERPLFFVGREGETKSLKQLVSDPTEKKAVVVGYYREGKTLFLKNFQTNYVLPDHRSIYMSFDNPPERDFSPKSFAYDMYRTAAREIDKIGFGKVSSITDDRPKSLPALAKWFDTIVNSTGFKFTLLLDEVSALSTWVSKGVLAKEFPKELSVFMEECEALKFVLVFQASQLYNLDKEQTKFDSYFQSRMGEDKIKIHPFNKDEFADFLLGPTYDKYEFTDSAVEMSYHLTGGNALLSTKLAKTIWHAALKKNLNEISTSVLQTMLEKQFVEDTDWEIFLRRMTNRLSNSIKHTIKEIANIQLDNGKLNWDETKWVDINEMSKIADKIGVEEDSIHSYVNRLERAKLLEERSEANNKSWRIRSVLIARQLSGKLF